MKKCVFWTILLMLPYASATAASLGIVFNDESAQIDFAAPLVEDQYGTSLLNGRFLYNDDEETVLGSAGFDFMGEPGNVPGLQLGLGAKAYAGGTDQDQDFLTLGVGGRAEFAPPYWGGLGIAARVFYAPEIFSLLDSDRLLETGLGLTFAVTPKIRLMLEYQNIQVDFEAPGTWTVDEGVRAGFRANF